MFGKYVEKKMYPKKTSKKNKKPKISVMYPLLFLWISLLIPSPSIVTPKSAGKTRTIYKNCGSLGFMA